MPDTRVLFVPFVDQARLVNRGEINPRFYPGHEERSARTHNHRSPARTLYGSMSGPRVVYRGRGGKMKITSGCIAAKSCLGEASGLLRQSERGYLNIAADFLFRQASGVVASVLSRLLAIDLSSRSSSSGFLGQPLRKRRQRPRRRAAGPSSWSSTKTATSRDADDARVFVLLSDSLELRLETCHCPN